jgi:hypothetical protein
MANHACSDCGAEFNVDFEEPSTYEGELVNYCPSCGAPIDTKEEDRLNDDETDSEADFASGFADDEDDD